MYQIPKEGIFFFFTWVQAMWKSTEKGYKSTINASKKLIAWLMKNDFIMDNGIPPKSGLMVISDLSKMILKAQQVQQT